MLQSVLTLDSSEQTEAMGFLQDCASNFGLPIKSVQKSLEDVKINENNAVVNTKESDCRNVIQANQDDTSDVIKPRDVNKTDDKDSKEVKRRKKSSVSNEKKKRTSRKKSDSEEVKSKEKDNNMFKCIVCSVSFQSKTALMEHFKSHEDSSLSCRVCRSSFSGPLEFWEHQKNKKCKIKELQCNECSEKFKRRRHYLKHILGHKDNNCRYCEEKFSTWTHYKNHVKEKHPDIKMERDLIPCKFCPMSFHRHVGLYNHYRVKHSKGKFVCLSCGLLLPTKEKHKEHVLVHESEKNWKCKICKMKFYRRQQLLFHVSIHKLGIYKCLTCDITVTSKVDLQQHKKEGHTVNGLERKFECEICHKKFAKRFTLRNHLATHSKEKSYTCKYCVKSFRTLDSLNRHQKRKSHFEKAKLTIPESKYEKVYEDKLICEKCGKQYKTQRELQCHLIVHKSVYECNECGKTFTLKFNLTKHLRLHRNPVGVVCELCGDTFNQLSALNDHCLMKHSDVRKAKCDICQKAFKRKSELNRHLRTHELKRPFVCFCGKAYKQSAHLQNHYKSDHGSKQEALESIQDYQSSQPEMFRENAMKKKSYEGESSLVSLETIESDFRPSTSYLMNESPEKMPYVPNYGMRYPQSEMEPISVNYEDLNFTSSQQDKRGLVFSSPAVDLSMVAIPEVVQNGMEIGGGHRDVEESVEPFNKIPDDASQIQLLNLSEHIVQEYLLNL